MLGHQIQKPLPQLLYSQNGAQSLYVWEVDCPSLITICAHERLLLQGLNNPFSVAQWSPDGKYIAVYLSESWAIYPAACLRGDQKCTPWRLDATANDTRIAWGPDGTTLAYITDSNSATMKILTRGCWDQSGERCFERMVQVASTRDRVDQGVGAIVRVLRQRDVTWARIGQPLGITRQSAWERYSGEE